MVAAPGVVLCHPSLVCFLSSDTPFHSLKGARLSAQQPQHPRGKHALQPLEPVHVRLCKAALGNNLEAAGRGGGAAGAACERVAERGEGAQLGPQPHARRDRQLQVSRLSVLDVQRPAWPQPQ
eukprot:CAMPEP_0185339106 /NCGR_PEP_ID=MMETSP1363-20130426/97454_1 /TAXON_ID=38817 /ORGANISM="Gephyrocapsa oceanica, Strain RCC1303" /LENGTH=122 /DNA_ID=CAMNT_0027938327 /DNA_START=34 /DNA_END=399 /DNA_ORIENTATION=-